MRILIIGGTRFVGRHITQAALAAGHEVTLLHRGRSGAELFPDAVHLTADRDQDLSVLKGMQWDATIDVSAYRPRQVTELAQALDGNGGQYVYISSVSVYEPPTHPEYPEDSPVRTLPPGQVPDVVDEQTYGPLKVLCEQAASEHFGPGTLVIRPTYVIGPHDHSGRFTYWVQRIARGGEVLAPGHPDRPIQLIDARDQGAFIVSAVAAGLAGTFHTVGPSMPFSGMLDAIAEALAPAGTRLTWVDPQFLLDAGQAGSSLPLWYAGDEDDARINTAGPAAAIGAGLVLRPLSQSILDIAQAEGPVTGFLEQDEESRLLAAWHGLGRGESGSA
jgi:2'-hydroxyisoflavone reductase